MLIHHKLADLSQYFTEDELSKYVDSYIQEGYFNQDGSASDQMEEAAKDGYEEVSENQEAVAGEDAETEETASEEYEENEGDEAVSEEALQEDGSLQKDDSAYEEVEETAAPYGTEAASAADPSLSEDDEWLYSKPRRFAKKPANEQKN